MKIKPIATGLASFLPGAYYLHARLLGRSKGQRVNPARYCYSVWLRHLVHAAENGLNTRPDTVAELGPGGSLGVGIAALITGASRYHGLEILNRTNIAGNLAVFSDLVEMFARREDIPADNEFPKIRPFLESYDFPHHILDDSRMQYALAEDRLVAIRNSIANMSSGGGMIAYKVPWHHANIIERNTVDMICSQAVLEHIDDLSNAYQSMSLWLKPDGYVSHTIDFKSHDLAEEWDGHRAYSDFTWKLIRGKKPYSLNRTPLSEHLKMLEQHGLEIQCRKTYKAAPSVQREKLAPRYRNMSEEDRICSGVFIQASNRQVKQ